VHPLHFASCLSFVPLLHTATHCISVQAYSFHSPVTFRFVVMLFRFSKTITSFLHSTRSFKIAPLLLKTSLTAKKRASPAETVSIRRAHSSRFLLLPPSLHSLTARACVAPKPTFHYAIASFQASFVPPRSRLFYLFRLKHSPCQYDIFIGRNNLINENTAKILWLQM
jgi:hypothetical protein